MDGCPSPADARVMPSLRQLSLAGSLVLCAVLAIGGARTGGLSWLGAGKASAIGTFTVPRVEAPDRLVTERELLGKVVLINAWASWCTACRDEHAWLMSLRGEGVPLVGLNISDSLDDARRWLAYYGDPYRTTLFDESGELARSLGIGALPTTLMLDVQGAVHQRHVGPLDEPSWSERFEPAMAHLGAPPRAAER